SVDSLRTRGQSGHKTALKRMPGNRSQQTIGMPSSIETAGSNRSFKSFKFPSNQCDGQIGGKKRSSGAHGTPRSKPVGINKWQLTANTSMREGQATLGRSRPRMRL